MKKLTLILTTVAVAAAAVTDTRAGDREWATAGKVLAGLAAFSVVAAATQPAYAPVYAAPVGPPPMVYQPPAPTYYAPPPTVQYPAVQYVPAPVVTYYAPPVYYAPAPRYYVAPPMYCAPPVVSIGFGFGYGGGFGGGFGRRGFGRGCW